MRSHSESAAGETQYFEDSEDGGEFDWETRKALKDRLVTDAKEFETLVHNAQNGDAKALAALEQFYGEGADLERLQNLSKTLSEDASQFRSSRFRKLGPTAATTNGVRARAVACTVCPNKNLTNTVRLSRSLVNEVLAGERGGFSLLHELGHFRADLGHPSAPGFYPNFYERSIARAASGASNYGDIYSYQGALRQYYLGSYR